MNKELKKYVKAYMDGEDVQYRLPRDRSRDRWYYVQGLSYFEDYTEFRIKPKAEDKWQRVVDEGYLCKFWDSNTTNTNLSLLKSHNPHDSYPFLDDKAEMYTNCEVLRKQGYIQPYFQGDKIPEIDGQIVVYFKSGDVAMMYADELAWDWSQVVAYIEV